MQRGGDVSATEWQRVCTVAMTWDQRFVYSVSTCNRFGDVRPTRRPHWCRRQRVCTVSVTRDQRYVYSVSTACLQPCWWRAIHRMSTLASTTTVSTSRWWRQRVCTVTSYLHVGGDVSSTVRLPRYRECVCTMTKYLHRGSDVRSMVQLPRYRVHVCNVSMTWYLRIEFIGIDNVSATYREGVLCHTSANCRQSVCKCLQLNNNKWFAIRLQSVGKTSAMNLQPVDILVGDGLHQCITQTSSRAVDQECRVIVVKQKILYEFCFTSQR